ncbi:MAG TPA: polysaccharide biosynthesis/export family protein, partial [Candidatus Saccharimonadales bacterium]|nr:polysaccharide biosynthesis/export family protein [Candidatus Saccharimonadales bacterium]
GAEGSSWKLVCTGDVSPRLVQDVAGGLVTVELPGTRAGIGPEDLPDPAGPVKAVSLGSDADGARLDFTLDEAASAMVVGIDDGVLLRIVPRAEPGDEGAGTARPLGTEDLLEISVFEVPDLNRTVRISESGTISLPLLGEIHAAGLTPRELELTIRDHLGKGYVKDPHVSVFVQEHGSKKVSVLGAVGKPGVYEMLGPRTLLQILAEAGGLTDNAGGDLYVIRASPGGGYERFPVAIDSLMTSRDPSLNLAIEPGDVVSVPPDRILEIYVDGAVRSPGKIEQPASREITLMQAIAKAGGATDRANLKKVQILRKGDGGSQQSILVNLYRVRAGDVSDPPLMDGDVVVVAETFF